jgi:hypothetical protein
MSKIKESASLTTNTVDGEVYVYNYTKKPVYLVLLGADNNVLSTFEVSQDSIFTLSQDDAKWIYSKVVELGSTTVRYYIMSGSIKWATGDFKVSDLLPVS